MMKNYFGLILASLVLLFGPSAYAQAVRNTSAIATAARTVTVAPPSIKQTPERPSLGFSCDDWEVLIKNLMQKNASLIGQILTLESSEGDKADFYVQVQGYEVKLKSLSSNYMYGHSSFDYSDNPNPNADDGACSADSVAQYAQLYKSVKQFNKTLKAKLAELCSNGDGLTKVICNMN